jgi:hypothetical protein
MAFTRSHLIRHRPFLYHFAPAENIERIFKHCEMLSAAVIVWKAYAYDPTQVPDPAAFLRTPHERPVALRAGPLAEDLFELNDQLPMLHESSFTELDGTRDQFIELLNGFVFYSPGRHDGPVTKNDLGQSFRKKYTHFAELRIPMTDV